jgi:hypothetical protein
MSWTSRLPKRPILQRELTERTQETEFAPWKQTTQYQFIHPRINKPPGFVNIGPIILRNNYWNLGLVNGCSIVYHCECRRRSNWRWLLDSKLISWTPTTVVFIVVKHSDSIFITASVTVTGTVTVTQVVISEPCVIWRYDGKARKLMHSIFNFNSSLDS